MEQQPAVSKYCQGEKCWCGAPATQKIEQVVFDDMPDTHPYTAYVCQFHFNSLMHGNEIIAKLQLAYKILQAECPLSEGLVTPLQLLRDVLTTLREH